MKIRSLVAGLIIGLTFASGLLAQSPTSPAPATPLIARSDTRIVIVEDGLFVLQVGRTMYLTDKKILFLLKKVEKNENDPDNSNIYYSVLGDSYRAKLGARIDLKGSRANYLLDDFKGCIIDVIAVNDVRGAPPSAELRFECNR